jgi:hypothetical protein
MQYNYGISIRRDRGEIVNKVLSAAMDRLMDVITEETRITHKSS